MQQRNLEKEYLILAGRTQETGQGSGLNLKDVVRQLSRRDASLRGMCAFQGVPVEAAVVRSLQSQLHSVNGRRASGDLIILPLSSMSEVSGIKTVLLSEKCSGIVPPSST